MKVGTPLGEYPFVFRRVETRQGGLAVVGTIAGVESSVVLEPDDLVALAKRVALPLVAAAVALAYVRSR